MSLLAEDQRDFAAALDEGPSRLPAGLFAGPRARVLLAMKSHANTISHGRLVALEDSFPLTRKELGPGEFNRLTRQYLQAPEPRAERIATIGAHFPAFLAAREIPAALVDLARVEWCWLEAFHAAEARPLNMADIAAQDEASLMAMTVARHPAARLCAVRPPLAPPLAGIGADAETAAILVTRPAEEVRMRGQGAGVAQLFARLTKPAAMGNLLEAAREQEGAGDENAAIAPIFALIEAGALARPAGCAARGQTERQTGTRR